MTVEEVILLLRDEDEGKIAVVVSGTGTGQWAVVVRHWTGKLCFDRPWKVPLDKTSEIKIVECKDGKLPEWMAAKPETWRDRPPML